MKKYLTIMGFVPTTPVDLESKKITKRTHLLNVLKKLLEETSCLLLSNCS